MEDIKISLSTSSIAPAIILLSVHQCNVVCKCVCVLHSGLTSIVLRTVIVSVS